MKPKLSNDEIIKEMHKWHLDDDNPLDNSLALIFCPPTFAPSREQINYVLERCSVPSNLRDVLKQKKTELIFAAMRHFNLNSRTRAWEYVQLFLNDYFAVDSQFLPKELHKSKKEWKKDSIEFWKGFEG